MSDYESKIDPDKIAEEIRLILLKYEKRQNKDKISKTKLYETLIANGVLKPGKKELFESLYEYGIETKKFTEKGIKTFRKKRGGKIISFSKDDLNKLFGAMTNPKIAIACYLTLICGLRISEACKLKLNDIDLVNCEVTIRDAKNSRRKWDLCGKERVVKFHPEFKEPIERWIEIIGKTSEWFLPSMTHPNQPLRKKSLHEQYRTVMKNAGLLIPISSYEITQNNHGKNKRMKIHRNKYVFHTLRHTYAQLWRDNGGDRDTLQKQLGHSDPATTQKYYETSEEAIQRDIGKVFGKGDYNVKTSTMKTPEPKERPMDLTAIELSKLDYEKKKLELEMMREQRRMEEMKNGRQTG